VLWASTRRKDAKKRRPSQQYDAMPMIAAMIQRTALLVKYSTEKATPATEKLSMSAAICALCVPLGRLPTKPTIGTEDEKKYTVLMGFP
jgi:hypothetical protein